MTTFIYDTTCVRGATFKPAIRYSYVLCQSTSPAAIYLGPRPLVVPTGLTVSVGQRVRASVISPINDPTQYIEGPVTSYSSTLLTINVDTISGNLGTIYSFWLVTAAVDLTGGTFTAEMRFSNVSCAGRARTPVTLGVIVGTPASKGVFSLYLSPTQTAALQLGDYQYKVLFSPPSSSDKLLVVSGTISVVDE
jgi:hypothetical protein